MTERWVVVSKVTSIEYSTGFPDELFSLHLPHDVQWPELVEATKEIDAMEPDAVARRFWRAAIDGDWETVL